MTTENDKNSATSSPSSVQGENESSSLESNMIQLDQGESIEMAHVLFMDIVAYSKLPMSEQTRLLKQLQEIVRSTEEYCRAQTGEQLLSLPTGDGMALVFFRDPVSPVRCALGISKALQSSPEIKLRMGVHSGPVYQVTDINTNRGVAGSGINLAQRVMDCGDAGHILLSKTVADVLKQLGPNWADHLHDIGEATVKHGEQIHVFNLCSSELGNPALPKKFRSRRKHIFLSYKRDDDDEKVATQIFQALAQDHDIFIDQNMLVGTRWAERIEAELQRSDFLIVLLSSRSVQSEMVQAEIAQAHNLAKTHGGRPELLPIRLNYREPFQYPLSFYLDNINWAFWETAEDTPKLIQELMTAISGGDLPIGSRLAKTDFLQSSETLLPPPSPSAQPILLEMPEGTMDPQSAFYVVRQSDSIASETIKRQGVTITIKGPRQMGKSSLLIRTIESAREMNKRIAFLDFQLFDKAALIDADLFFRQFCAWLTDELEMEDRVAEYWNMPLGNSQRCTRYFSRCILKELDCPLVLAMDEVESIFDTDFRSDFFSMLRSWHNSRATTPAWKKLDLVLVTSTEPYQLIENLNQSPFNVGQIIELTDFTTEQVIQSNHLHGSPLGHHETQQLIELLGGHPYLVRRALYLIADQRITSSDLFANATDDRGPFGDHLRYHLFRMHDKAELVQGMRDVLLHSSCQDERIFFRLRGAGLVRRDGRLVLPRCQLYREYFREHLHV
jgi:class 3 adenylate cyclase